MKELDKIRKNIDEIDRKMADLFYARMREVKKVAIVKKEAGIEVFDPRREEAVLQKNSALVPAEIRAYYTAFLRNNMALSKKLQSEIMRNDPLYIHTMQGEYPIYLKRGALKEIDRYFDLDRKVLIVTDSGVPFQYVETVEKLCKLPFVAVFSQGENAKNIETYQMLLRRLTSERFSRGDCVIAVGGGVVGDIAGFAASTYMRGIDFYNVPTTLLSQVDSSIGGKTAIDYCGYKNIVGSFYPPKGVLIDSNVLSTLSERVYREGLAEAVKMAAVYDAGFFSLFEKKELPDTDTVILHSLRIKKSVVEADEKEAGLRRVLNFGHTIGHALESVYGLDTYYHGECVALGMLYMCAPAVRNRIYRVIKKIGLPTDVQTDPKALLRALENDKKISKDRKIAIVYVPKIGKYEFRSISPEECLRMMEDLKE